MNTFPIGSACGRTSKVSMTIQSFVKWINHFHYLNHKGLGLSYHFLMESCSLLLTQSLIGLKMWHFATFFRIFNSTNEHQLFFKSCFRPFGNYGIKIFFDFGANKPWVMTPANVKDSSIGTGIYPFKPNVIHKKLFCPVLFLNTHAQQKIVSKVEYPILPYSHLLKNKIAILLLSLVSDHDYRQNTLPTTRDVRLSCA